MTDVVVSIIIPTLNEVSVIRNTLNNLQQIRRQGFELILADGGSTDNTLSEVDALVDHVIQTAKGRASQMNAGAKVAQGKWLLFLHADTLLPNSLDQWLLQLNASELSWGFFPVHLHGTHWFFRCIEFAINLRSRSTQIATGDQSLFIRQELFAQIGRYPDIELMEDVAICKKLRAIKKPFIWQYPVITSSRRWQQNGKLKTVLLMWYLRLAYFLGVSPRTLHRMYYGAP